MRRIFFQHKWKIALWSPLAEEKEIKTNIICLQKEEFDSKVLLAKIHFIKPGHKKIPNKQANKKPSVLSLSNWSIFTCAFGGKVSGF